MATIAENLQSLVTCKNDIATAITNKGVILPENAGFRNFASAIDNIETSTIPPYGISSPIPSFRVCYSGYSDYTAYQPGFASMANNIFEYTWDTLYTPKATEGSIYELETCYNVASYGNNYSHIYQNDSDQIIVFDKYRISGKTIQCRIKILSLSGKIKFNQDYYFRASVSLSVVLVGMFRSGMNAYYDPYTIQTIARVTTNTLTYGYGVRTIDLSTINIGQSTSNSTVPDISSNSDYGPDVFVMIWPSISFWRSKSTSSTNRDWNFTLNSDAIITPFHILAQIDILNIS